MIARPDSQALPVEALLQWVRLCPTQAWLFQPNQGRTRVWTWREAAEEVACMAAALRAQGWEAGSRIAISGLNTAHWVLADLAIQMAGYLPVGLYPKQSAKVTRYMLEHSRAKALFLGPMSDGEDFLAAVPDGLLKIRLPYPSAPRGDDDWDHFAAGVQPLRSYHPPAPERPMLLIYTSGTTGNPKGVLLSGRNLRYLRGAFDKVTPPPLEDERLFSYLPLAHFLERLAVEMASLLWGAQVHFLESFDKLAEQLPQVAPTRFMGVPLVWSRLQAGILHKLPQRRLDMLLSLPLVGRVLRRKLRRAIGLDRARFCLTGAAPIPPSTLAWFRDKLGVTIQEGYGPTESGAYCSLNIAGEVRFGSVGRPMPDAGFRLSQEGEIQLRHPGVMLGYYEDPEQTRASFTDDGWLKTGDKGRLDADGYLYITGRLKDIFKTQKGKYVAPAPIEGALARNTDIDQMCLIGAGLTQPVMLMTLAAHAKSKPREQLRNELREDMEQVNAGLESHEKIARLCIVREAWTIDNGIMTPAMKVRRDEVEQRFGAWVAGGMGERDETIVWEEPSR
ncbi:AMP-binding protein [Lysobacter sp. CA199]|uniref:AMP-binding protein n=1 Tax=Lysobacter sp. CA199 TaxID=3455608 RepID=UPI003F8D86E8